VKEGRVHLAFLDGIRGLAALYVMLYHCYVRAIHTKDGSTLPDWLAHATNWMGYGHHAIAVFIVLSGYCLMLPVFSTPHLSLAGGPLGFMQRRARRILPPYYVALLLSILMIVLGRKLHIASAANSAKLGAQISAGSLISHLLLLHNFSFDWSKAIDPPMWSVATEWDIYLVFALLLLPIWRRLGLAASVGVAFALPLAAHYLLPPRYSGDWAAPWFLGFFALGMVGAALNFSPDARLRAVSERAPWGALCAGFTGLLILLGCLLPRNLYSGTIAFSERWAIELIPGLATLALIVACVNRLRAQNQAPFPLLTLLQARWTVGLGAFSYSLYLIHQPIVEAVYQVINHFHRFSALSGFVLMMLVIAPMTVAASYGFHLAFERPFLSSFARKRLAAEQVS
jgi:peptidoglycan/LPS O-acetylase OafA/YrhL